MHCNTGHLARECPNKTYKLNMRSGTNGHHNSVNREESSTQAVYM